MIHILIISLIMIGLFFSFIIYCALANNIMHLPPKNRRHALDSNSSIQRAVNHISAG
jgi:hypothetical protein